MSHRTKRWMLAGFAVVLVFVFLICLCVGRFYVPPLQTARILFNCLAEGIFHAPLEVTWNDSMESIILNVRFPRLLAAVLVGAGLSVSGAAYQGVFKNPLVSPDLLGVSAGATVGASLAILLGCASTLIQLSALAGGFLAVFITVSIPKLFRNNSSTMLVLAGIIIAGFMSSLQSLMKYIADPEVELSSVVFWTLGSLASIKMTDVLMVAPAMLAAFVAVIAMRWRVNLLSLGESEALSLGVHVSRVRGLLILCSTVLTACSVCMCGTIGWIGLVIPHFSRLIIGEDNRYMIPASVLLGASFMVIVDTFARNLTGSEIPLSIITGVLGTPVFIWLLKMQKVRVQ